jgi:hypothetical protein
MSKWTLAVVLSLVWPADVLAVCSGGARVLTPLGWTEAGETLVMRLVDTTGCARRDALVRWHRGDEQPAACFDLRGDKRVPTMPVPCDELRTRGARHTPDATGALADATAKAKQSRAPLRVTVDRTGEAPRIVVQLKRGGAWSQVYDDPDPACAERCSPRARLFEAPEGSTAALLVDVVDPSTRARATRLAWITLPKTEARALAPKSD